MNKPTATTQQASLKNQATKTNMPGQGIKPTTAEKSLPKQENQTAKPVAGTVKPVAGAAKPITKIGS